MTTGTDLANIPSAVAQAEKANVVADVTAVKAVAESDTNDVNDVDETQEIDLEEKKGNKERSGRCIPLLCLLGPGAFCASDNDKGKGGEQRSRYHRRNGRSSRASGHLRRLYWGKLMAPWSRFNQSRSSPPQWPVPWRVPSPETTADPLGRLWLTTGARVPRPGRVPFLSLPGLERQGYVRIGLEPVVLFPATEERHDRGTFDVEAQIVLLPEENINNAEETAVAETEIAEEDHNKQFPWYDTLPADEARDAIDGDSEFRNAEGEEEEPSAASIEENAEELASATGVENEEEQLTSAIKETTDDGITDNVEETVFKTESSFQTTLPEYNAVDERENNEGKVEDACKEKTVDPLQKSKFVNQVKVDVLEVASSKEENEKVDTPKTLPEDPTDELMSYEENEETFQEVFTPQDDAFVKEENGSIGGCLLFETFAFNFFSKLKKQKPKFEAMG